MTTATIREHFVSTLFALLDETFEHVHGIYLDRGTSLFETLAGVTAEQASQPISASCASIAAQVEHVRFYLEVMQHYIRGEQPGKVDWQASWQRQVVTPDEWQARLAELRAAYQSLRELLSGIAGWEQEDELGGALAAVVHTAYHLGEIRQALGVLG